MRAKAIIGSRTSAALQAKRARGERAGTLPFGHQLSDDGRTLEENPFEQAAMTFIRTERANGATLVAIADTMTRHSVIDVIESTLSMPDRFSVGTGLYVMERSDGRRVVSSGGCRWIV